MTKDCPDCLEADRAHPPPRFHGAGRCPRHKPAMADGGRDPGDARSIARGFCLDCRVEVDLMLDTRQPPPARWVDEDGQPHDDCPIVMKE